MATQPISDLHHPPTRTQNLSFDSACDAEAPDLTFEAARLRALSLQMQFAAAKAGFDAKTALARYLNPQVSNWANAFDNKLLGKVAYTVGTGSDGATHVATRTMGDWVKKFAGDHSCTCSGGLRLRHESYPEGKCPGRVTISVTTFREHFYRLPGVTERTMNMQPVLGRGGRQRWNDGWTKITLNMGAVVREKPILTGKRGRPEIAQWTEPWDITSTSDYYTEKLEGDVAEGLIRDPMTTQRGPNADNLLPSVPRSVPMTLPSRTQEGASAKNEPGREEGAASVDLQNTFIVWRAKSGDRQGEWLDFSLANRPRRAPKDATTVTLTPKEAAYLRQSWPMEKGLDPAARAPRAETRAWFLLATEDERAALIAEHEAVADAAELAAREEQAEREAQAAAERQRLAAEIESFRPKFTAIGHEFGFDMHVRMWQKDGLSGEAILIRLPGLLEKRTAEYERQRTRDEYADRFHDGKSRAARDYVSYQTSGHEPDMIAFMRAALAQGTNVPSQMTVS